MTLARIDTDGTSNAGTLVDKAYTDKVISGLGITFGFDAKHPEIVRRIKRMGWLYVVFRRGEDKAEFPAERKRYKKFAADTQGFLERLESFRESELHPTLYYAALRLSEPPPKADFPGLTKHEKTQSSEPYYLELVRLLHLLKAAAEETAGLYTRKSGPRANFGLEILTIHAAQFFEVELNGRPFTIDPQKPFKATEAYDFVKALVTPLDNVTHDQIVTAIRAELRRQTDMKKSRDIKRGKWSKV